MKKIQVGFLMSYDYEKLKNSIPPVYEDADAIFLAVDENLKTWSGESFEVDNTFYDWLKEIDKDDKIEIFKDNFYIPELSAIQNDTRERYLLSQKMGIGNWLVQIDADEICLDFKSFVKILKKNNHYLDNPERNPVQFCGFVINIYKFLDSGILYVNQPTRQYMATNYPNYKVARKTKERIIYTDAVILHECLSRTEEELRFKMENWGHNNEINPNFFDKWMRANETNYKSLKNLFYLEDYKWKSLGYFPTKELDEIALLIKENSELKPSKLYTLSKNVGQWLKHFSLFRNRKNSKFESYF